MRRAALVALLVGMLALTVSLVWWTNRPAWGAAELATLQTLARVLGETTRAVDFVARYGGEEFVILLPHTPDAVHAMAVAEKIRAAIADTAFPGPGRLTVSIGASLWQPADPDAGSLIARADAALYQAKAAGRNRVVLG